MQVLDANELSTTESGIDIPQLKKTIAQCRQAIALQSRVLDELEALVKEMERKVRHYMPQLFVSEYDKLKNRVRETVTHILERIVEGPDIQSMDRELMERVMRQSAEEHPFIQFIYATDIEGKKITKNITQIEDKAKYAEYEVYDNYADRSWFQEPLRTGKVSVSNIYTSKVTGRLTLTVSAPIFDQEDRMAGVLAIDIKFEELARLEDDEEA